MGVGVVQSFIFEEYDKREEIDFLSICDYCLLRVFFCCVLKFSKVDFGCGMGVKGGLDEYNNLFWEQVGM